jgi:hypothetical protein
MIPSIAAEAFGREISDDGEPEFQPRQMHRQTRLSLGCLQAPGVECGRTSILEQAERSAGSCTQYD